MIALRGFGWPVLVLVLASVTIGVQTRAEVSCHRINAKAVGQDLGGGSTVARVVGGGLLNGSTEGNFVITGVAGTLASFTGSVIFTTRHATLTVTVTGSFDVASGEFSASGPVTDATGKLAGATGRLSLEGVQDLEGTFLEDVTGDVCVDLAR
jgi:hypothetical protein